MIAASKKRMNRKGFTLVEVIVTILAAAILGAIFINYMGTAMSQSTRAIEYVRGEADAEATLEWIVADYVFEINKDYTNALDNIKKYVEQDKRYGSNVSVGYVIFDTNGIASADTTGSKNTLKVVVAAAGNDLTTLLTKSRVKTENPAVAF
jgi:prepilin-type N-terminal cleavage/methylation domain-containing protein